MKKKGVMLCFVFFLLVSTVIAQEQFEESISVLPPPPPDAEFNYFFLYDFESKELIKDIHVDIIINRGLESYQTLKYIGEDGRLDLFLEEGQYVLEFRVDRIQSDGKDYYFKFDHFSQINSSTDIFLFPVGSVIGVVYDQRGDVIGNAQIKVECSGEYGEVKEISSDEFGTFSSFWLPLGTCRFTSRASESIGFTDVEIEKGTLKRIEIVIGTGFDTGFFSPSIIIILLVVLIVVVLWFTKKSKKDTKKKNVTIKDEKENEKPDEKYSSTRAQDILKTLREKEAKIVKYLIENDNKSTQAKLRYGVNMAKTSLSRALDTLEQKRIVKIERIGKMKKVELTDWYLGKE
jgi:predicted transcriptional regulator